MVRLIRALLALVLALSSFGCPQGPKTVTFAAIVPLSGPEGTYGESIKKGIELAYREAQERSDDLGFEILLTVEDSGADPARAAELLNRAYANGALAAIGGVTSAEALEMVAVADEEDRILISPSASSPDLTGSSSNFYRVFPSDFVEGTKMGNFARQTLELEDVVIIAVESPFGKGIQGVFQSEFERHGGAVREVIEYPVNTSDFSGLVERIVTIDPQAVYVAAFWDETAAIIRLLREEGYGGRILTTAAFATQQALDAAGEEAEGVFFTQTVFDLSSDSDPIRSFVADYRRTYNEEPDLYAAHGFDSFLVLETALREAKSNLSSDFWRGMRAIRSLPGVTGSIQFDEKGDVQKYPRVYLIKDGSPINYEEYIRTVKAAVSQRLKQIEERKRRLQGS